MPNINTRIKKAVAGLSVAAFVILTHGCESSESGSNEAQRTGSIRILATDAPFPFQDVAAATVVLSRIHLRSVEDATATTVLLDHTVVLELTQLRGGITALLADRTIPVGRYDEIRLVVDHGSIDLKDGRHFDLTVPSGSSSGLKIQIWPPLEVTDSQTATALLDFDLSGSFTAQGGGSQNGGSGINGFHFHPVVRASNLGLSGTLSGATSTNQGSPTDANDDALLEGAIVSLLQEGREVASAGTDEQGYFQILGLSPGLYDAKVEAPGHTPQILKNIQIVLGQTQDINVVMARTISTPESVDIAF